jgi:hypothetical protein
MRAALVIDRRSDEQHPSIVALEEGRWPGSSIA